MNSTDKNQAATKNDIEKLNTELKTTEKSLRSEIKTTENTLRSELKSTEKNLRSEIKTTEKKLRTEILRVEEKVETLQEGQVKMTFALTTLQNTLDGFVGAVDDLRTDNQVGAHHVNELDARVSKLESLPQPK